MTHKCSRCLKIEENLAFSFDIKTIFRETNIILCQSCIGDALINCLGSWSEGRLVNNLIEWVNAGSEYNKSKEHIWMTPK